MNDNMMYMTTIAKELEPLYYGTPEDVQKALPGLMKSLGVMHNVSKTYSRPERMTVFLKKITNQLIKNGTDCIQDEGKFWNQKQSDLIHLMQV